LKIHRDEKKDYTKKIDRMKDDMARKNKEIQKERKERKKP
jgi:hypothetical protein